jgi:AcrR family transcriptional regulator
MNDYYDPKKFPKIKENLKARQSQKIIYKGLRKILLEKPLKDVTVSDICRECNVSRATFYRNYSSITEILEIKFDWFYQHWLDIRKDAKDQLLFFLEYWYWHRDLITIIAENNSSIILDTITKREKAVDSTGYQTSLRFAILTGILIKWGKEKSGTAEELCEEIRRILRKSCSEILLS